jgi:hypothetical protein
LGVAACGLVGLGFVLIFLWKIYKAGGEEGPEHMRAAASALREARWRPFVLPSRPGRRDVVPDPDAVPSLHSSGNPTCDLAE